ncbi:hypothetical protein ACOMHN_054664 [Nucella lapillus]
MASFGHVGPTTGITLRFSPINIVKIAFAVFVMLTLTVKVCSSEADDHDASTKSPTRSRSSSSLQEPVYFDQFYAQGVRAYSDQLWYKCAHNLEKAIKEYKTFKKTLTDCRLRCKQKGNESDPEKLDLPGLGDLSMFETFLRHANCFRKCKSDAYSLRPGLTLTKIVENTFESRKPYQYLQYCYYKLDRVKLAACASYTFYLKNPGDVDVKRNIAFYRDKAKVPESDFVDLELVPYKEHYIRAMMAYGEEDWPSVTDHLEKTITDFLVEEERCRADCQDDMDTSSATHFSGIIADHFLKVLECQLGCEGNLSIIYTEPEENFFSEIFHYLQYTYYKTDQISEAVAATASCLLFRSGDEVLEENKKIFMKKYHYDDEQFVPREDAKTYADRREKLQALHGYLQENFMKEVPDVIFVTAADAQSEPIPEDTPEKPNMNYLTWMDRYERLGLHLIAKDSDLHRPFRFAADGLLKQEQCEDILTLMEDIPVDKKGVQIFTLTLGREKAPEKDENYEASLRLFMRATEVMRHYTQRYYNMSGSLFFKKTVMVCWRQVPDPDVESDCIPQEFGTCDPESNIKESELVEDQFVTVTYLNSMDDGDMYFLGENTSVDTSLGVKFGRTVGFQHGDRHGLHIPSRAPRCAMVLTYTTQQAQEEQDYAQTSEALQRLENIRMERGLRDRKDVLQKLQDMGVQVVKNSTTLHGGERFVADGLASDAECDSLKNMVMSGALVGDGYDLLETKPSYISPHTEHELFQGLTIYRASKLMHSGVVNTFAMKSFLDLSEKSRLMVEKYFNLTKPLYFDFTHLVCRTPIDETRERDDLSHPVHADNCILKPDGSCVKEYPAYVQRDYSALLYLNDDFRGGEFFFAHPNKSEQVSLQPRCGRLVGFNAKELHGVRAVRGGTRCALAMWFTLNPNFKELAHVHARKVLHAIQTQRDRQAAAVSTPEGSSSAHQTGSSGVNKDVLDEKSEGVVKADKGLDEKNGGSEGEDLDKKNEKSVDDNHVKSVKGLNEENDVKADEDFGEKNEKNEDGDDLSADKNVYDDDDDVKADALDTDTSEKKTNNDDDDGDDDNKGVDDDEAESSPNTETLNKKSKKGKGDKEEGVEADAPLVHTNTLGEQTDKGERKSHEDTDDEDRDEL